MGVYHNSAAVIDADGKVSGLYRKMHIPDDPSYYEKFYFTPGDLGFKTFDTKFAKSEHLICWDQWYPEGARMTALQGASILFYPTAIGWHPYEKAEHGKAQFESWQTIQRGHAIANGIYVAAANRIGLKNKILIQQELNSGADHLFVIRRESFFAEASQDKEEVITAEVDLNRIEYIRRNWPFLRDRRIDAYDGITKRFLE
jgi:N-carbamoylputrescine amidase